jgi:hypothetical protein
MAAVGNRFRHRLNSQRIKSWQLAQMLGVDSIGLQAPQGYKNISSSYLAGLTMRAVVRFCQSADIEPTRRHVPIIEGIDHPNPNGYKGGPNNDRVAEYLVPFVRRAWKDVSSPTGTLPYRHDHYLKLWQLSEPRLHADFVLFDEAQDAAPVMLAAIEAQRDAQVVWVGDSQQQIYEWRGAVNALASVDANCRAILSQSFRFGPAIAEVANACLTLLGAELRLSGLRSIDSRCARVQHPRAVLCRTNAAALSTVLNVLEEGRTPHLVGGGRELVSFAEAAALLQDGERASWHPELACFASWSEVMAYVEQDPQGDDLALMAGLVEKYGTDVIREALDATTSEANADLIVSTAHKAKGREWDTVRLAGDFITPGKDAGDSAGEWRLLYVAATRARLTLDYSSCEPLTNLIGPCR